MSSNRELDFSNHDVRQDFFSSGKRYFEIIFVNGNPFISATLCKYIDAALKSTAIARPSGIRWTAPLDSVESASSRRSASKSSKLFVHGTKTSALLPLPEIPV
jgi:hypothetical protein